MDQAKPIFERLVQRIHGQGLFFNSIQLHIELQSRAQLSALLGKPGDTLSLGAALYTTYAGGTGAARVQINGVAILRSLPSALFKGAVSHELGHVWLAIHGVLGLPDWANEGFCELLAYRFHSSATSTADNRYYAKCIEENPDAVYGEGFRQVHTIAESIGFTKLLETLRKEKRLPVY